MSFFRKNKQKTSDPNALPPASRDLKSSDGPGPAASTGTGGTGISQIPTLNGIGKPSSPKTSSAANGSLNSISSLDMPRQPARGQDESGSLRSVGGGMDGVRVASPPNPEQKSLMERSQEPLRQRIPTQASRMSQAPDPSPYPWSARKLVFDTAALPQSNPFPRYGAAVNSAGSKDGSIYLMGGLVNGSTVKGDLWTVDAGSGALTCLPVATTSEGPGPRVGHSSLLVGNAFIVFGGDTKIDESDMLDDTLYLLNTSTKQWSRALPGGSRPPGRYGHTLNILGSRIYIFGGQVEGYFFNDLYAFDLNALQQPSNQWELLVQNTIDGGPTHGQIPPARTNHSMVTYGDRMYLFGGTDGVHWFNDVWSYSPQTNSWTQLDCIGYIPSPREGHSAALVGDVMYVFGGRTEDGHDLGDLAAFRITTRRWYTFQNMGPSPSARSGHSMTTIGRQIVVLAGEPSSAPRDPVELAFAYFLDTSKIRYPPETAVDRLVRRPSGERLGMPPPVARSPPNIVERDRMGSGEYGRMRNDSRLPQATRPQQQIPAPSGPPSGAPAQQMRQNDLGVASRQPTGAASPSSDAERAQTFEKTGGALMTQRTNMAPETAMPTSPGIPPEYPQYSTESDPQRQSKVETYQPSQDGETLGRSSSRAQRQRPMDSEETLAQPPSLMETTSQVREEDRPQDSGIGSSPAFSHQYDSLIKELEQTRQRNAWYASELALARKSGYQTRTTNESPPLDDPEMSSFDENDKPLIQALLKMKAELARVQQTIDEQSKSAAERIAEVQSQRDAAISEAVYAKTRLAGQGDAPLDGDNQRSSPNQERSNDLGRRLASSLGAQVELSRRIDGLVLEVDAEKKARQLAEDTAGAAQKRMAELELHRQTNSAALESLRAELHDAQLEAREASASHAEIKSRHDMLVFDNSELSRKLDGANSQGENHTAVLSSLRNALTASNEKAEMLEQKWNQERDNRSGAESQLRQLRAEHEQRSWELEDAKSQLQVAQELANKHAEEARTHREVVLAGLGAVTLQEASTNSSADERVTALQQRLEDANALMRQNQSAADTASDKLRRAEERIAGLEAFQEQASREGLSIRKQLQAAIKENQSLSSEKAELDQKMQSHMLESNALAVQHASLKDVLVERGINPVDARRSRIMDSPNGSLSRFSTPDLLRVRDLEAQLEATLRNHEDLRSQMEEGSERDGKSIRELEEKLTLLDNDHQVAVKYLRGTEKMLSKMKQELQRTKNENGDLRKQLTVAQDQSTNTASQHSADWESERERLQQEISDAQHAQSAQMTLSADLETRLESAKQEMQRAQQELEQSRNAHASSQADLATLNASHAQIKTELERIQLDNGALEQRARDAESKVQVLLDQVETSVDNYRRQSRLHEPASVGSIANGMRTASALSSNSTLGGGPGTSSHHGHSRSISNTSASLDAPSEAGRDSMALDMFASELETLRSQWETTNKNFRLSDRFDFEHPSSTVKEGAEGGDRSSGALGSWRPGLGTMLDDEDEEDDMPTPHIGSHAKTESLGGKSVTAE